MAFFRGPRWALLGTVALAISAFGGCGSSARSESPGASREEALLGGCSRHKDCEDANPCTQNLCVAGACLPALPVLGCCFNGECFGSAGSGGSSSGGTAAVGGAVSIGGAVSLGGAGELECSVHADCEDPDPCTQNLCVVGACLTLPVLGCVLGGEGGAGGDNAGPLSCSDDD